MGIENLLLSFKSKPLVCINAHLCSENIALTPHQHGKEEA
jgi:hypothetical protein